MNRARLPTRGDAAVAAAVLEVLLAGALAWRRIAPLTVTVLVAALTTAEAVAGVPLVEPLVPLVAAVLAVYALGVHRPTVPALAGTAVLVAALGVQTRLQHKGIGNFLFGLIFAGGTWAVARVVRSRTGQTVALQARAAQLVAGGDSRARQAAAEERARIARELHDVIAHSVSVMVVQAGAAEQMVRPRPAAGGGGRTGRAARRAAGPRRAGAPARHPPPGRRRGRAGPATRSGRAAGTGRPGPGGRGAGPAARRGGPAVLPPGVELSLYRVVQEALTNARKHAAGAPAVVVVRYRPGAVEAEIIDDGTGSAKGYGGGHGLIGMRERVAVYGGTLHAGPAPGGGYGVQAHFPVQEAQ